jgi:hypothetical protein
VRTPRRMPASCRGGGWPEFADGRNPRWAALAHAHKNREEEWRGRPAASTGGEGGRRMGRHACVAEKSPEAMKMAVYGRGRRRGEKLGLGKDHCAEPL